jgi:PilZ domain
MAKENRFIEKRVHSRVPVKIPVKYRLEKNTNVFQGVEVWRNFKENAYTLDMALGGMKISVDRPLKIGDVLEFEIFLFFKFSYVNVYSRVVWVNGQDIGIKFLAMKEHSRSVLEDYLKSVAYTQSRALQTSST